MASGETVPDIDFDGDYVEPDPAGVSYQQEVVSGSLAGTQCAYAIVDFDAECADTFCGEGMDATDAAAASDGQTCEGHAAADSAGYADDFACHRK